MPVHHHESMNVKKCAELKWLLPSQHTRCQASSGGQPQLPASGGHCQASGGQYDAVVHFRLA